MRMKFTMRYTDDLVDGKPSSRAVTCTFTNGNGITSESWFSAPMDSIDHACFVYIADRFRNVLYDRQADFIKRRYKEEIIRLKNEIGIYEEVSTYV